jgi:hypothetical protein
MTPLRAIAATIISSGFCMVPLITFPSVKQLIGGARHLIPRAQTDDLSVLCQLPFHLIYLTT